MEREIKYRTSNRFHVFVIQIVQEVIFKCTKWEHELGWFRVGTETSCTFHLYLVSRAFGKKTATTKLAK